jgi:hypothetical protein
VAEEHKHDFRPSVKYCDKGRVNTGKNVVVYWAQECETFLKVLRKISHSNVNNKFTGRERSLFLILYLARQYANLLRVQGLWVVMLCSKVILFWHIHRMYHHYLQGSKSLRRLYYSWAHWQESHAIKRCLSPWSMHCRCLGTSWQTQTCEIKMIKTACLGVW